MPAPEAATVLVCGLGALGQTCLQRLLAFDVRLRCLDRLPPRWRDPELEARLETVVHLGDMRRPRDLEAAGVREARGILLLSSDSTVNLEAALQVRLLNPTATVVVRASSQMAALGSRLQQRLPGVAVVDPMLLLAGVFGQCLRPAGEDAGFSVDGVRFELRRLPDGRPPQPQDPTWHSLRALQRPAGPALGLAMAAPPRRGRAGAVGLRLRGWLRGGVALLRGGVSFAPQRLASCLIGPVRARPLPTVFLLWILLLLLVGVAVFAGGGGWPRGLFVTLGLLKGEYVDPVNLLLEGGLSGLPGPGAATSPVLLAVTLVYAIIGTVLTSALVALILERFLSVRLGLLRPRVLPDGSRAVLLIGGEALAELIADQLRAEGLEVAWLQAGRSDSDAPSRWLQQRRTRELPEVLRMLRRTTVAGVGLLSDDLLMNLRLALDLGERWPGARLALRTKDLAATESLAELLGGMVLISSVDVAADAFVATAFGESVEGVLRLAGSNLLLVRYRIEAADTLAGRSIARVQGGYGITVVSLMARQGQALVGLPALERRLRPGQELVVLADLEGLRRVEQGRMAAPGWRVRFTITTDREWSFETQQCLARHLGEAPGAMARFVDGEEHVSPALDHDLARQLAHELRLRGSRARAEPITP